MCQLSGECPTSLVHHEIEDTDILTHNIGPIHRPLVLPVRVDHAVAKVHEQLCVCVCVGGVCVCVCVGGGVCVCVCMCGWCVCVGGVCVWVVCVCVCVGSDTETK